MICQRTGKVRFGHKETAEAAVVKLRIKWQDPTLEVYECSYCDGGWHLGHRGRSDGFVSIRVDGASKRVYSFEEAIAWMEETP